MPSHISTQIKMGYEKAYIFFHFLPFFHYTHPHPSCAWEDSAGNSFLICVNEYRISSAPGFSQCYLRALLYIKSSIFSPDIAHSVASVGLSGGGEKETAVCSFVELNPTSGRTEWCWTCYSGNGKRLGQLYRP